jgi:outer membrane protein assembly factor BamB
MRPAPERSSIHTMWRAILVCPLAAGLLIPVPAQAEHTRFWRQSDYSQFEKGTAQGVALRSDGKLMPAPHFAQFSDPNLAYLWALRVDSKGRIYAAGGSNAKVLRLEESGKATTVFESQELAAQALAIDSHDNLYVGTSPDGKVYKVTPDGQHTVFFEPKTKYIWALAFDSDGTLFVGTGDEGEVFAVAPDGKGSVFYKSDERHARSLIFDGKGNLVIGTDPNGLIVRVEKSKKAGKPVPEAGAAFVLYETSKKEITALASDASGNLYAAAIGEKIKGAAVAPLPAAQPAMPQPNITITVPGQQVAVAPQAPVTPQVNIFQPFPALAGGSEVYRIAPDGSPQSLWSSHEDLVYSLGLSSAGKLLLGTGNRGAIIQLEGNDVFSSMAKTASAQVTSFAAGPGATIYVATANPGKVFALGPGYAAEGTFESDTFDAKIFSQWGRLTWWGENGAADGKVSFYVRSGNTSSPAKDWSPWAGPYANASGETVKCPPARFVQWKAVFQSAKGDVPNVSWVSLAYLPKNVAPVIDAIVLEDPGVRAQGFPIVPQQGPGNPAPVPLRLPQTSASAAAAAAAAIAVQEFQQRPKGQLPTQGFVQRGYQSVVWAAHDDNDDELTFSIYYRGEGEKNWRLLKDKIEQRFYAWDTTAMPDGAYILKIVASDAPSNPPDEALTTERESDRFEVANTPPVIQNLRADPSGNEARVRFSAQDAASDIARAEYSLDAGEWQIVFPAGRLSDSRHESYEILCGKLGAGEHTFAVQVYDRFENSAAAKVTFTIAARTSR